MNWKMLLIEIGEAMGKFISKYFEATYFLLVVLTIISMFILGDYAHQKNKEEYSKTFMIVGLVLCPYALVLFRNFIKNDP